MKNKRLVVCILVTALLVLGLTSPVVAQVEPTEVIKTMNPGETTTVVKTVTTPSVPPLIDIFLLEDETQSFFDDIATLQALAPGIWDAVALTGADFTMGVGGFRDFAQDAWGATQPPDWVYRQLQDLTETKANFLTGVGSLTAAGGADMMEAQLEALHYLATPGHPAIDSDGVGGITVPPDTPMNQQPTWRPGAYRVVLLATDALCHVTGDPSVPPGLFWPGCDPETADAGTTAGIVDAAGITVIGLVPGGAGTNPCVDTLAGMTGGSVQATTDTGDEVKTAIMAGLVALTTDVWWTVTGASPGLSVVLTPVVHNLVEGGTSVSFTETITVDEAVPLGTTLTATVTFWANTYPDEGSIVGVETIRIRAGEFEVVGGEIAGENSLTVIAPWMAIGLVAVAGGSATILLRRRLLSKGG